MKKLSLLLAVLCCLLLPLQSLAAIPEAPADGQSLYVLDAANVIDSADENAMLALGAALCPECLTCKDCFVDVECFGQYTRALKNTPISFLTAGASAAQRKKMACCSCCRLESENTG